MTKIVLISTASLFGLAIAAGGTSAAADLANAVSQLTAAFIDAFVAIARVNDSMTHEIVSHAPHFVQALLGFMLCAQWVLVVLGLSTLRMIRRFIDRMF